MDEKEREEAVRHPGSTKLNRQKSLLEWLATLEPIEEGFPPVDDPPPEPFDL